MSTSPRRAVTTRREEELELGRRLGPLGNVHVEKRVEAEQVVHGVPRDIEHAAVERVPARSGDSGEIETLPDGSVSIPVLEEEVVVTKRVVVRERIVVRKESVTVRERVEAEVRRERVDVDVVEG
jgi:uncharacterized protein (TIGR02271 family)